MPKIEKREEMWFDYPDDPLQGRALIVHLSIAERSELVKKASKSKTIYRGKDDVEQEVNLDQLALNELIADKAIREWENFFDEQETEEHPNGRPLLCNTSNKKLFSRQDGFMDWVNNCLEKLKDKVEARKKAALKN